MAVVSLASLDQVIILQFWYQWKQHMALLAALRELSLYLSWNLPNTDSVNFAQLKTTLTLSRFYLCREFRLVFLSNDVIDFMTWLLLSRTLTSVVPWQGKFYLRDFLSIGFSSCSWPSLVDYKHRESTYISLQSDLGYLATSGLGTYPICPDMGVMLKNSKFSRICML